MKKIIVEDSEKNLILQMHRLLMKEQTNSATVSGSSGTSGSSDNKISPEDEAKLKAELESELDLNLLIQARKSQCLKDGKLLKRTSTGKHFYRKPSVKDPSKYVDFFSDMTYQFTDGSKSGKWRCPGIIPLSETKAKIATYQKQEYKTKYELIAKKVDLTTLDRFYDKINVDGIDLYKEKNTSTNLTTGLSTDKFNAKQQEFIDDWVGSTDKKITGKGYILNPTPYQQGKYMKVTPEELGAPKNLFPDGFYLWYDPNTQKDISRKDKGGLDILNKSQSMNERVCKNFISTYYKAFKMKTIADTATITRDKINVQACKNQYYRNWGFLSNAGKFDDMLEELSDISDPVWRLK